MDNVLYLTSTNSTNDDAYQLALNGAEHGYAVLADSQCAGKGRLGKKWQSPTGTGLYCSIILRPNLSFLEFPKLTLTAGLSLSLTVESLFPGISFGLKWPNDLYGEGKKCGGILVESSTPNTLHEDAFIIVGIGLNVNTNREMFSTELKDKATSLYLLSEKLTDIPLLFREIHQKLLSNVRLHETHGFDVILKEWRKRDFLLGKEMQWVTRDKKIITARGMGPDENGQLLARDKAGNVYEILSGDVQLATGVNNLGKN